MAPVSTTYHVTAKPWEQGWELHIEGVGVTQVTNLAHAEQRVRDYIETELDVDTSDADIVMGYELDKDLLKDLGEARSAVLRAARAQVEAAARSREVVRRLRAQGLSQSDIAHVVGVSKGRVSQLVNS